MNSKVILFVVLAMVFICLGSLASSCKTSKDPIKPDFVNYWETNIPIPTDTPTPCLVGGDTCTPTHTSTPACTYTPIADVTSNFLGSIPTPIIGNTSYTLTNHFYHSGYGYSAPDDLYSFRLSAPRTMVATTCNNVTWDNVLYVRTLCADETSSRGFNDDGMCTGVPSLDASVTFLCPTAGEYFLIIDGYTTQSGPYTIVLRGNP